VETTAQALLDAQARADELFGAVVDGGLIRPGVLETELAQAITALARERFGVRRHWHRQVVRSGPNTVLIYADGGSDRVIEAGDLVILDFGPVFDGWEADYGRTYLVGDDPLKAKLIRDVSDAFARGKAFSLADPGRTAGEIYDYVAALAPEYGWTFGAPTAGHLVGHFPHEPHTPGCRYAIEHGNTVPIRAPDAEGRSRHWILEIHFVDRERRIGAFVEELLTL
jgi:Xaa-Pro aminopeptidase